MNTIYVRECTDMDRERVRLIRSLATAELRQTYRPCSRWRLARIIARKISRDVFVATRDHEVVGVVEYVLRPNELFLRGLAVHPGCRMRGVAGALMERAAWVAREAGARTLALMTIKETGNPAVFEKLGFAVQEERPAVEFEGVDGGIVTQVRMVRQL